jgi:FkbM family methyltransferase
MTQVQTLPSFKALTKAPVRVKVVDIGANPIDGTPPYLPLLAGGDAEIVGFEPNPDALGRLNARKSANETYLPYAVGDGLPHVLHICAAEGMTSLLKPNPQVLGRFHGFPRWSEVVEKRAVQTVKLDDIAETAGLDLLKIDIQGGELMAFRSGEARLKDALVIQTEVEFMQMYVDQPLFGDVDVFLRQHGFVFHKFFPTVSRVIAPMLVNNSIYSGMSQILWADALFVKDFTRLDRLSDRQLLAMATIMHDCYQSYDLVLLLLTEHDARNKTQLAAAYLSGLTNQTVSQAA